MSKLYVLIIFAGVFVVLNNAVPSVFKIGLAGSPRKAIKITKLGIKVASKLTPCEVDRAPNQMSFRTDKECVKRCPGHCASIMNCNATCVLGNRCVCAAWRYCLLNREKINPDGSYGSDCYNFDDGVPV